MMYCAIKETITTAQIPHSPKLAENGIKGQSNDYEWLQFNDEDRTSMQF